MKKPSWLFEVTPEMGGATGGAFTTPLLGTGMEPAAVLAREAIQNSVDAGAGGKVRVEFRRLSLTGNAKKEFVEALSLAPAFTSRRGSLHLPQNPCLDTLNDPRKPIQLLYVEDYGTFGLYGNPTSSKSHFFRLLLSLGDGRKVFEAEGSGGSYGFGKSVYTSNSKIRTVVAYSVFDPKLSGVSAENHARLMGCSYFDQHDFKGKEYSGRAWFGKQKSEDRTVEPLVDKDAHGFAELVGFKLRGENDRGTSLLIVDCGVECDLLRDSIEDSWWPRILDGESGLDIKLYDQGTAIPPPRPRLRNDLKPFIECYDLAIKRSVPVGNHQRAMSFNKLGEYPLGDYGFTIVDENLAADERLRTRLGSIALIRKPRMVIEYMEIGGGSLPLPCVGTFVAAPEIDTFLKVSEPAAHNKWDAKSDRLNDLPADARAAVTSVIQRLKNHMRKFAGDAAPKATEQESRLRSLEKLLGNMFRPPTTSEGGEGGSPSDPIRIHFIEEPTVVAEKNQIATQGAFRISLSEDADRPEVKLCIRVLCYVQEDEGLSKEDPIPVELKSTDAVKNPDDVKGGLVLNLQRNSNPLFSFKSQAYTADWTTNIQVRVEEV